MSTWPTTVVTERQPDKPKESESPLEALMPNPHLARSAHFKYFMETIGVLGGLGTVYLNNVFQKRPNLSGIQRYPLAAIIGGGLVHLLMISREKQWAERDAIYRHYISLHPEDFPPYKRTKYADVFEPWTPIR